MILTVAVPVFLLIANITVLTEGIRQMGYLRFEISTAVTTKNII
jgi:hypothetical protein